VASNNSSQRTEVAHGEEKVKKVILQFLSKADRIDSCVDHKAASLTAGVESYNKVVFDLKNRGVKTRYITEITRGNIQYCKEMMKIANEVRHIDGIKANFSVSDTEYIATTTAAHQEKEQPLSRVIYSNVKDIVEHQQYIFESFWNRAISADQKIKEIEEGDDLADIEVIRSSARTEDLYLNIVKAATKEILLIFPTTNAFIRQYKIGAVNLAKEATKGQSAKFRILMPFHDLTEQTVLTLKREKNIQIRYIEQMSETKATILVVDRKSSLVMELRDDSKPTFVEAIGLATFSNSKAGVLSYVAIFENLWKQTELYQHVKESNKQLALANDQLKVHEKMQKEFINIAAHELRSPIQPILSLSQLLRTKINDTEQRELLDATIRNAKRLKQLTENILDVTKIESRSLALKKERFNLTEMVRNAIADLGNQIRNEIKDNNIKLEELATEDVIIEADRGRVNQVISNLLDNAVKFTRDCTITVTIEKKNIRQKEAIVSIKDTGIGIDPEILPRLFTKFAKKLETAGTGLGLFISKSIIEAHKGRIWAENNDDGKGATFSFSLPIS
jgi:two-component system sensor histidine kinase VicK